MKNHGGIVVGAMDYPLLQRFPGVIGFPVTPFNDEGEFDQSAFESSVRFLLDTDLTALAFCGSNGELPALTIEEHKRVSELAVSMTDGSKGVIVGAGQTLRIAQSMARNARAAGADAVMIIAPYTNDMNEPGLAEYYRAVAGESQLPCFLYQTKWSGVLSLSLLDRLANVENICMVKDENGDISHYLKVRANFGPRYFWVNGMAEPFVPSYWNLGVRTFTSGLACFMPQVTSRIRRLAQTGNFAPLNRILDEIVMPLYELRNRRPGYKCSMIKAGMNLCGLPGGRVRAPMIELAETDLADLDRLLVRGKLKPDALVA